MDGKSKTKKEERKVYKGYHISHSTNSIPLFLTVSINDQHQTQSHHQPPPATVSTLLAFFPERLHAGVVRRNRNEPRHRPDIP